MQLPARKGGWTVREPTDETRGLTVPSLSQPAPAVGGCGGGAVVGGCGAGGAAVGPQRRRRYPHQGRDLQLNSPLPLLQLVRVRVPLFTKLWETSTSKTLSLMALTSQSP